MRKFISRLTDFLLVIAIVAVGAGILFCTPTLTLNPLTWLGAVFCVSVGLLFVFWGLAIFEELVDKYDRQSAIKK